jgi:hypothetical protein
MVFKRKYFLFGKSDQKKLHILLTLPGLVHSANTLNQQKETVGTGQNSDRKKKT